ncbi:flagellar basal body rod protein FlgB [Virgibacillus sp. W0430]|uniref:flagellar basal body rod protein FlgB n=1 Tax=Virgibacillus sp. W0430 TaxID=3391580 RepID=UPI003F45CE72
MKLFNETFRTLEHSLQYSATKNEVISNNIANIDTPNYKAKNILFKSMLDDSISALSAKQSHSKHIPFNSKTDYSPFRIVSNRTTSFNHNGNNVDIDKEMSDLAKNQIYYQSLIDRLNGKFGSLQTVIRGGR